MKNPLTWIIALLVLIVVLLLGVALGWFSGGGDPETTASPTATQTAGATPTGPPPATVLDDFVARPVTAAGQVPTASALTGAVLESVGANWVVAIHNGDSYDDGGSFEPGPAILYLISPAGDRYELANLDSLGFDSVDLVAWNYSEYELMLVEDGAEMQVFDMVTGAVTDTWSICGEAVQVRGTAKGSDWVLRGSCEGEGFDGLYASDGTSLPSDVVGQGFGESVVDVGDTQVLSGFEIPPEDRFHAYYADGTDAYLDSPGDCYPLGKGRGATVAANCYGSSEFPAIWEIPVNGDPGVKVITGGQVADFRDSIVGSTEYLSVTGYCADSAYRTIVTTSVQPRIGTLDGGTLEPSSTAPYIHQNCHAAVGTKALVSGNGPLWWVDWDSGVTVELLPGAGDSFPLYVVGAAETRALAHP